jgi:hypothetical protein
MDRKRNFVGQNSWARGYFVSTAGRDEAGIRRCIRDVLTSAVATLDGAREVLFAGSFTT